MAEVVDQRLRGLQLKLLHMALGRVVPARQWRRVGEAMARLFHDGEALPFDKIRAMPALELTELLLKCGIDKGSEWATALLKVAASFEGDLERCWPDALQELPSFGCIASRRFVLWRSPERPLIILTPKHLAWLRKRKLAKARTVPKMEHRYRKLELEIIKAALRQGLEPQELAAQIEER